MIEYKGKELGDLEAKIQSAMSDKRDLENELMRTNGQVRNICREYTLIPTADSYQRPQEAHCQG